MNENYKAPDDFSHLDQFADQAEREVEVLEAELKREEQESVQGEAERLAAEQGAILAVSFAETLLKMKYSFVVIDDDTKGRLVEKTAPVMLKHGGGLPDWLLPYREEVELGIAVAVAGFGVYVQVQAHKQAEEARKREEGGEDENPTT